jgi:hypothetical protein
MRMHHCNHGTNLVNYRRVDGPSELYFGVVLCCKRAREVLRACSTQYFGLIILKQCIYIHCFTYDDTYINIVFNYMF